MHNLQDQWEHHASQIEAVKVVKEDRVLKIDTQDRGRGDKP